MPPNIFDVAIVGGGPAGLSAATWLGRYLHSVAVIDSGDPRNWETLGVNGYLGLPGIRPAELRGRARDELRQFENVTLVDGAVEGVAQCADERFALQLADGRSIESRRLLLAIGLKDVWPDIEGLDHCYGDTAHVCPDCDGFGARDKKTVVVGSGRRAAGMALNLTTWTRDIVICTNGEDPDLTQELEQKLDALGIPLITDRVLRVHLREGGLRSLVFEHTPPLGCEEIFFTIGQHPADDLGVQLGCKRDEGGHIIVDAHYHTSVLNVYAAGDIVPGPQLAISAASDGAIAALSMHKSLVPEERKLS